MDTLYKIERTLHLKPNNDYNSKDLYPNFQEKILEFQELLAKNIQEKIPTTFYKFGDGDYYFLKKKAIGSAKPGSRALSKPYFLINHSKFLERSALNDYYTTLLPKMHTQMFFEIFNKSFDFPTEIVYGLLANKWLLNNFNEIGLIGADKKLELVDKLLDFDEYKEYLGIPEFTDYISIPQKYACDNLSKTLKNVEKQLVNSKSKLFLVGVGHVKSGLLSELKKIKNAVFLDIGVGIDALAGIVNIKRPYFGLWNNFQIKNDSIYKDLDILINDSSGSHGQVRFLN